MVDKTTDNKLKIIDLFRSNYLLQFHVREIAKLLKKSHVTLLPHLGALEQDNILISKRVGKNKFFSLNLNNIITKNYLVLAEVVKSNRVLEDLFLIKKITTELFSLNLTGTIILFGSYAKGIFLSDSDIDIFYLGILAEREIKKIKKIGEIYGKTINIKKSKIKNFEKGLRIKDPLIIEVLKNHIILQNHTQFINQLWRYYCEKK